MSRNNNSIVCIETDENPHDIVLHNLKVTDKLYDLSLFMNISREWFKLNPKKNFYNFELYLRIHGMTTHIIAKKDFAMPDGSKLISPIKESKEEMKYMAWYSCRPKQYAMEELLKEWNSYEENLQALKYTGELLLTSNFVKELKGKEKVKLGPNFTFHPSRVDPLNDLIKENKNKLVTIPTPLVDLFRIFDNIRTADMTTNTAPDIGIIRNATNPGPDTTTITTTTDTNLAADTDTTPTATDINTNLAANAATTNPASDINTTTDTTNPASDTNTTHNSTEN